MANKKKKIIQKVGWLWIWVWALCMGCPSEKKLEGMRSSESPSPSVSQAERDSIFALLIGVNSYRDTRANLRYVANDVRGLRDALSGPGQVPRSRIKVLLDRDATKKAIESALVKWLPSQLKELLPYQRLKATIIIYFAGHGETDGTSSYWVPYDADISSRDKLYRSSIRHDLVQVWLYSLRDMGGKWVVLFQDACHSGFAWSGARNLADHRKGLRSVIPGTSFGEGFMTISSSKQNQKSVESNELRHGVFSYVLIQALRGEADYTGDGRVCLTEILLYLESNVRKLAEKYTGYPQEPGMEGRREGSLTMSYSSRKTVMQKPAVTSYKTRLKVSSIPSGATVYIDDVNECQTPCESNVEPGMRVIKLKLEGYALLQEKLRIPKNQRREIAHTLCRLETPPPPPPVATVIPPRLPVSRRAGNRQTVTVDGTSFAMRFIPARNFMMGSPDNEPGRNSDEGPQRRVELTRPYWMMETEVTQGQYQRLMGYNPSRFSSCGSNCPVEEVNWYEACEFANALSRKQGLEECYICSGSGRRATCEVKSQYRGSAYYNCKGWRLPTEAEWEYVYRAGSSTAFYNGTITKTGCELDPNLDKIGWYCNNSGVKYSGCYNCSFLGGPKCTGTSPIGGKQANAWGLHDMAGNVWEWVHDWYQDSYNDLTEKDPVNDKTGSDRVLRGGSFFHTAREIRAAYRFKYRPSNHNYDIGFRLLRLDLSSK
jgi:formylglycine-generating enzyme required for sulfatase activity